MKSEVVIERFSEMLIKCMERQKSKEWKKGWFGGVTSCAPVSLSTKKPYNGMNAFFLILSTIDNGWKLPIFATFKQIKEAGGSVKKGAQSLPILYWDVNYKDENGHRKTRDEYNHLSTSEQEGFKMSAFLKSYNVFNVEQTDLQEKGAKRLLNLMDGLGIVEPSTDISGMYVNNVIDEMLSSQSWLCSITYDKMSGMAYYSPTDDKIVIPCKSQFRQGTNDDEIFVNGQEYYSTLLHEMAHSTGSKNRLNREGGKFGDKGYAKEELVAEMSSALCGQVLGFDVQITENNARYLDNWIKVLRKEPNFIVSVMADVSKAVNMMLSHITLEEVVITSSKDSATK